MRGENKERTMKEQRNAKQPIQRTDWRTGQKFNEAELIQLSLEAIQKRNLMFMTEIPAYLPCSLSTFYGYHLARSEVLKEALSANRTRRKVELREKWYESDNAISQIALYKLIGTSDELERLNSNSRQTHEHKQLEPFTFTLDLNPNNRIAERLQNAETRQITGESAESNFIDAEADDT
jgi:hypothetical protein